MAGAWSGVKALTVGFVCAPLSSGVLAEEFKELVALDLEVIGELFGGQVVRKGLYQGVALPFEQFEGEVVIFCQRTCPATVRLLDRFV